MSENKLCPFCGNKCYLIPTDKWKLDEDLTMVCNHCQMEFRGYGVKFSEEALLARWNTRKGEPRKCCANCKHITEGGIYDDDNTYVCDLDPDGGQVCIQPWGKDCEKWEAAE